MNFITSIKNCIRKYAIFEGRASKSEFSWFFLSVFAVLLINGTNFGFFFIYRANLIIDDFFTTIFLALIVFLTLITVGARKLQDINRSNWIRIYTAICFMGNE